MDRADFDRLRLIRSPRIGPVTYRQLLERFGSASEALAALPDLAGRGGGKFVAASEASLSAEIDATKSAKASYLFLDSPDYPHLLAQLDNAPPAFTWRGNLELFDRIIVAMVGARNASASACKFARRMAHELGQREMVVVSGLARGIDTSAHRGALESGTIAVIAGGIDVAYPPENTDLQNEIALRGLLLAEQPPGVEPKARHFPFRNRIIAGLAQGTVVIEAAPRSGSLITARLAAEAGRSVMAVPGSPLDPRARGCNQLIRDGATLVQDADEVAELLGPIDPLAIGEEKTANILKEEPPATDASEDERSRISGLLGHSMVAVDEIVRQSGSSPATVQLVLLELELAGKLERGAGGKVCLTA